MSASTAPSPKVRFAILGFGYHAGKRLVPGFADARETELVGLWRRDREAAAQDCAAYGIAHNFASREDLCASPEVDAVFITSPDAMHLDDALLAIKHGKAILCEKPLAMNQAEALEIERTAAQAGVLLGVAQNLRWSRTLLFLREQVRAGRVGSPQLARALFSYAALQTPRRWITDSGLACGGPLGDVGVHCLDALRFVLDREFIALQTLARQDANYASFEAIASIQAEMEGGCLASVAVSALAPYRTQIEILGSEGVLVAENGFAVDDAVAVELRRGGDLVERTEFENTTSYTDMVDSFAAAMRGGPAFAASAQDGVMNMRLLDAAYRGWKTGSIERITK